MLDKGIHVLGAIFVAPHVPGHRVDDDHAWDAPSICTELLDRLGHNRRFGAVVQLSRPVAFVQRHAGKADAVAQLPCLEPPGQPVVALASNIKHRALLYLVPMPCNAGGHTAGDVDGHKALATAWVTKHLGQAVALNVIIHDPLDLGEL